jgi:hypothetical protein
MWVLSPKSSSKRALLTILFIIFALAFAHLSSEKNKHKNHKKKHKNQKPTSFLDDLHPLSTDVDCGEETALLQRTLQLELLMRTSKGTILNPFLSLQNLEQNAEKNDTKNDNFSSGYKALNGIVSTHYSNNDLSFDQSLDHLWFASCNHQNREQELWYNLAQKTSKSAQNPNPLDSGQLFLWLGDAIYMDRPPNPLNRSPADQRTDAVRQLWRENYCKSVRRQIPINGMIDDHDFGLNNAGFDYYDKFRTKGLFFDFLDFPNPIELGASLRFTELVYHSCGSIIGCLHHGDEFISDKCKEEVRKIVRDIHGVNNGDFEGDFDQNSHKFDTTMSPEQKYSPDVIKHCYINYNAISLYDGDETSMYALNRLYKHQSSFENDLNSDSQQTENIEKTEEITEKITEKITPKNPLASLPSPPIFNPNIDFSHITPSNTRSLYEATLEQWYTDRRNRHGTYDSRIFGALFRRIKTILVDVRVGKVNHERMLLEPQWRWLEDELNQSIIPKVGEVYFEGIWDGGNREKHVEVEKMEKFEEVLGFIFEHFSEYNLKNGQRELNLAKIIELKNGKDAPNSLLISIQSGLQCQNSLFSLNNVISLLTKWNNGQYRHFGSDLILLGSGILISSYGKLISEGWREEHLERTRILALTANAMANSKRNVQEWKFFLQAREQFCGEAMPMVKFRKSNGAILNNLDHNYNRFGEINGDNNEKSEKNEKNEKNSSFFSTLSQQEKTNFEIVNVPLINAIKPVAVSYLTGDVHFSEGARTYLPVNLAHPEIVETSSAKKTKKLSKFPVSISNIDIMTRNVGNIDLIDTNNELNEEVIQDIKDDIKNNEQIEKIETSEKNIIQDEKKIEKKLTKLLKIIKNQNDELDYFFGLTNDTNFNGLQIGKWVEDGYFRGNDSPPHLDFTQNSITPSISSLFSDFQALLNNTYDPNSSKIERSDDRDRFIVPLQDITTSGITHGWGGGDPTAKWRIGVVEFILNTVLRPEVTNIDYINKHTWLIDQLEMDLFGVKNGRIKNVDKIPPNPPQSSLFSKSTLDTIRTKQPLMWVMHNIGDVVVDWDKDVVSFVIRNKDLDPVMWYTNGLDHIRAYTLPEINSWVVNERGVGNWGGVGSGEKMDKKMDKKTTSLRKYLNDMEFQLNQEVSVRLHPIVTISQRKLEIFVLLPLLCLILFGLYKLTKFIFNILNKLLLFFVSFFVQKQTKSSQTDAIDVSDRKIR